MKLGIWEFVVRSVEKHTYTIDQNKVGKIGIIKLMPCPSTYI